MFRRRLLRPCLGSKSLFVIARNSSFTYKGKPVNIKQVGRELGVRYVLEGAAAYAMAAYVARGCSSRDERSLPGDLYD
jgi:TolB-like protein